MYKKKRAAPTVANILAGDQPVQKNGKKRFSLSAPQREALAENRKIEEAVALFLDPEVDRTNGQIATALGLSTPQLKRMMATEKFRDLYEATLVEVGHSPRLKQVRQSIDEMLPIAARVVRNILTDANAPAGIRLKAAQHILEYAPKENVSGDQVKEFQLFMASFGQRPQDKVKITVPDDYRDAMKQFVDQDVIDAEVTDIVPVETQVEVP